MRLGGDEKGLSTFGMAARAVVAAVLSVLLVAQGGLPALGEEPTTSLQEESETPTEGDDAPVVPDESVALDEPDEAVPETVEDVETSTITVKLVGGLAAAEQVAVIERNGGTETSSVAPLRLHTVALPADELDEAVARYLADPQVESVEVDRAREVEGSPSDPGYGDQWALPQIGWPEAYGSVAPSGTATIAVLDTGVDASHPDLGGVVVGGFSALDGVSPTNDPNGHGTAMATIAAAATDNAVGTAGVAYAGASVMPVTVLDADGIGWDSDIIEGVVWAADNGADVILMAFSNPGYSQHLQDAVDYAWSRGAVLVAATGNGGSSEVTYPAGTAKVMGVSATDSTDGLWSGSNHGAGAFIAAPGVDIANGSGSTTGTSASAAIVAGAAALVQANDPAASNGAVVGRLARNADPAGTADETGNGRVNLARSLADESDEEVVPVGSGSGDGGPIVGPYVAAAATANSATLNGASTVSVAPSASVTAAVSVTSGNGVGNRAGSIGWRIDTTAPGAVTCVDIEDHNGTTRTDTFTITAPASSGTYNAYFVAYSNDVCTLNPSNTLALTGAVTVQSNNPVPTLTSISPGTKSYGDPGFTMTVTGTNFITSSEVRVAGSPRATTHVSATQLTAEIPASDLLSVGTREISVFNPTPGGGTSGSLLLTVNQRTVSPSFSAANKVYDGTTPATITDRSLTGAVAGDDVSLAGGIAAFVDKNVDTGKTVNAGDFSLAGTKAGNYVLSSTGATATANITARPLTVSAIGISRAYDGTTNATVTLSDDRVSGDALTTAYTSASFDTKDVGIDKAVNVSGISITGGVDAGNYILANTTAVAAANITARSVSGSFTAADKVYDGTDAATINGRSLSGDLAGDDVALVGGSATFADEHVGDGKTVTGTGFVLEGDDAGNYSLASSTLTTTADITAKPLSVTADNKTMTSGDPGPTLTATFGTFAAGEGPGDLDGTLALKVFDDDAEITPSPATPAGIYDIRPSGLTSTNYEITFVDGLLTVGLRIEGFYKPVDMTPDGATRMYNSVKGGSTVPLKFRVYSGLNEVVDPTGMSASWRSVNCVSGDIDPQLLEADSTSAVGLRYSSGQFIFNWAVPKGAGKCYQVTIVAADGTQLDGAFFRSK
jgi:subtilisin family serine protease